MRYSPRHAKAVISRAVHSMTPRVRAGVIAGAVLATGGGLALASAGAGAATADCTASVTTHNAVTGNYCGSQEIVSANVELSVPNKVAAYSRLTFKTTSTANPQQDFEQFNPAVHGDNQKVFEYDPRGNPSGLCVAVSNNGALPVLKPCNDSSAAQQWVANGPDPSGGYEWTSEANGKAISDPDGAAYTRAVLVAQGGSSFTFEQ